MNFFNKLELKNKEDSLNFNWHYSAYFRSFTCDGIKCYNDQTFNLNNIWKIADLFYFLIDEKVFNKFK